MNAVHRALKVAFRLGKNHPAPALVVAKLHDFVKRLNGDDPLFFTPSLLEVLHKSGEDITPYVPLIENGINKALGSNHHNKWEKAISLIEIRVKLAERQKDQEERRKQEMRIAEVFLQRYKAEYEDTPDAAAMKGVYILRRAVEAYRRAGNCDEEVAQVKQRIENLQPKVFDEMEESEATADTSKAVEFATNLVKGKSTHEAILLLGRSMQSYPLETARRQVSEARNLAPLSHTFGKDIVDDQGRIVARQVALLNEPPERQAARLEEDMMQHLRLYWGVRAQSHLEPARWQMAQEHTVQLRNIMPFVRYNPFIPEDRELIYAKGLLWGFWGEYMESTCILVPQVEHSLRYLLESRGTSTRKLDKDGIQDWMSLNSIFEPNAAGGLREELIGMLGEDTVFDLRALLMERFGANLRNQHSHGLMDTQSYYSGTTCYFWGKTLNLVVTGAIIRDKQVAKQKEEGGAPES